MVHGGEDGDLMTEYEGTFVLSEKEYGDMQIVLMGYRIALEYMINELVMDWKCPYGTEEIPEKCRERRVKTVDECQDCWVEYCAKLSRRQMIDDGYVVEVEEGN